MASKIAQVVMVLLSQRALLASGFQLVPARGLYPASPRLGSARGRPLWVAQQIDAAPEVRRRPRSIAEDRQPLRILCVRSVCVCARSS